MVTDGHHVAIASNFGIEGAQTNWNGIEVFPRGFDAYSNDIIGAYAKDWAHQHPDARPLVFTLYDCWVYEGHPSWEAMPYPVVSWVPIDHTPIPPKVAAWCERPNVTPVAMSKFGAEQLTRLGVEHVCIPHGIETDLYKPTPVYEADGTAKTGRELMGVPDGAHVTGIINANKGVSPVRKSFDTQLLAWSIFAKDKPDAYLYLHTERYGAMGGIAFDPLLHACDVPIERVKWVNQYQLRHSIPDEAMAAIYTGLDVLLAPTLGEGFGLTVAEASAAETPCIVQDFTAQPELVVDGWVVDGQPHWDPAQASWFSIPNVHSIVRALEESYERRGERSPAARQHIVDNYDADTLYREQWRPFFDLVTR